MKAADAFFGLPRELRTRHNITSDIGQTASGARGKTNINNHGMRTPTQPKTRDTQSLPQSLPSRLSQPIIPTLSHITINAHCDLTSGSTLPRKNNQFPRGLALRHFQTLIFAANRREQIRCRHRYCPFVALPVHRKGNGYISNHHIAANYHVLQLEIEVRLV
jgi:hypothetical protein